MIQFWRRLSDPMTHHQVGRITVDRSFVREPSYSALTSLDAAPREDLGVIGIRANLTGPSPRRHRPIAPTSERAATPRLCRLLAREPAASSSRTALARVQAT